MSLYKCEQCGVVENTAVGDYWGAERKLCSECSPSIGKWHGRFPKENATEAGYFKDSNGFIYHPCEVDVEKMEWTYNPGWKIIGKA